MSVPYVGFSNETLAGCPSIKAGDKVRCNNCFDFHPAEAGDNHEDTQGEPLLLFYRCPVTGDAYLAGVAGKNVTNAKVTVKGRL